MLESLKITNFALLESAFLEMSKGFNAVTGETGAGKSILVGSLTMVLGEWVGREIVRSGSEACEVEASFNCEINGGLKTFLEEKGLGADELILRRKFYSKGMSKCYVNDHHVTLATLKELGNYLVDIHSQNQHQTLLSKKNQREILDRFAGNKMILDEIGRLWKNLSDLEKEKTERLNSKNSTESEIERLKYEIFEIDSAGLYEGLDEEIEKDYRILNNYEKLNSGIDEIYSLLYENNESTYEGLCSSTEKLTELSEIDSRLKEMSVAIGKAVSEVEYACESLRSYKDEADFDISRLEEVMEVRNNILDLKRKYGDDIKIILDYRNGLEKKIADYDNFDGILDVMDIKIRDTGNELNKQAVELTKRRKKASEKLSVLVVNKLDKLGMKRADFKVRLVSCEIGPAGREKIEFHIKTNPGQPEMELAKIASGGEISRIMLAIKSALANYDNIPVLVFDEIDTGIGATIASSVGREIKNLAEFHQIIAITHLPQIAGYADMHFRVNKKISKEKTRTIIETLNNEERVKEISRMFGGEKNKTFDKHAREVLKKG